MEKVEKIAETLGSFGSIFVTDSKRSRPRSKSRTPTPAGEELRGFLSRLGALDLRFAHSRVARLGDAQFRPSEIFSRRGARFLTCPLKMWSTFP